MRQRDIHDFRTDLCIINARLNRIHAPATTSGKTLVALGQVKILAKELDAVSDDHFMRRRKELDAKFCELGMPLELNDSMVDLLEIMKILNDF